MTYENECNTCDGTWESEVNDEACPHCGEDDLALIETDPVEENES